MIATFTKFIANLHLSIGAWLAVAAATLIGGLVAALKVEGSRLHKAQIQLIDVKLRARQAKDEEITSKDWDAYFNEMNKYLRNGGSL